MICIKQDNYEVWGHRQCAVWDTRTCFIAAFPIEIQGNAATCGYIAPLYGGL